MVLARFFTLAGVREAVGRCIVVVLRLRVRMGVVRLCLLCLLLLG